MARKKRRYSRRATRAFESLRRRYGGSALELTMYTDQVNSEIDRIRRQRLFEAAREVHLELTRRTLRGPRSGRFYKIPRTNRWYQASAPGEAPAYRTGNLVRGYTISPRTWSDIDERITIGTRVPYARILELALDRAHLMIAYQRAAPRVNRILRAPYG